MHISKSIPDKEVNDLFYVHKVYVQFKYNVIKNKQKIRYRLFSSKPMDYKNSQCTQTQCVNRKGRNINKKKENGDNRKVSVFVLKYLNKTKEYNDNMERKDDINGIYDHISKGERSLWI